MECAQASGAVGSYLPKVRTSNYYHFYYYTWKGRGGGKKAHTTLYVTEFTEEWGFRRRLEEYLTQNRERRAASGPRVPVLGHSVTWSERTAGSLNIPPNLKSSTSRAIKSRGSQISSGRRKKGHNLDEWNWAKGTRSRAVAEVRKREVKDFFFDVRAGSTRPWSRQSHKHALEKVLLSADSSGAAGGGEAEAGGRRSWAGAGGSGGAGDEAASRRRARDPGRGRALARVLPRTFHWTPAGRPAPRPPPARPPARPPGGRVRGTPSRGRAHAASPGRPAPRAPSARTPAARSPRPRPPPAARGGRGGRGAAA